MGPLFLIIHMPLNLFVAGVRKGRRKKVEVLAGQMQSKKVGHGGRRNTETLDELHRWSHVKCTKL